MKILLIHDDSAMSRLLVYRLGDERMTVRSIRAAMLDPAESVSLCESVDAVLYVSTGWDDVAAERDRGWVDSLITAVQGTAKRSIYVPEHPWRANAELRLRLREAASTGTHCVIIRPTLVHGQGAGPLLQRLVTYAEASGESVYVDDGASRTSTVHIDDVISLIRAALAGAHDGCTYVAASDEVVTWRDVAIAVARTTRGPCRLRSITTKEAATAGLDSATMAMAGVMRDHSDVRRLGWSAVGPELVTDL
jgi:hypothetical protein